MISLAFNFSSFFFWILRRNVVPLQAIYLLPFKTFTMMTKKKLYERPSMKVVLLKRQPQLLAGSGNLDDYQWNGPTEE